ncbi:MAG TPA: hypothetical protein VF476_11125 [Chitinophagaceae bacterium]
MKKNFLFLPGILIIAAISCKSKAQKDAEKYMNEVEKTMKENSPANTGNNNTRTGSPNIPSGMESLLGEWKLVKKLRDDNGNHKIDADEENAEIKSNNYMKFNGDGSCKFEELMDGSYEIITEEDGRKRISIHDTKGSAYPFQLYILSVKENDLVINSVLGGGSQFDLYKRP